MKAVQLQKFGGVENLVYVDLPIPKPESKEVLIKIQASGVCYHDTLTRKGVFPRTILPVVPGHQIAGIVEEMGTEVTEFKIGDRVACMPLMSCGECEYCLEGQDNFCVNTKIIGEELDGGYAEYAVLPEFSLLKVPDNVPSTVAAVAACSLGTPYTAIKRVAKIKKGETVVLTGASGGLGTQAISLLNWIGARVIAITSSTSKINYLELLGVKDIVVAENEKFSKKIKVLTNNKGADAVLDIVGGPFIIEGIKSLRQGGRSVVIGNVAGVPIEFKPALLVLKAVSLLGTKGVSRGDMLKVFDLLSKGEIKIDTQQLPLKEVPYIHQQMDEKKATGRAVLIP
jgi:acryloyl-coenzyme A reductase